ncbi:hypothetical protein Glove_658g31 [Diversispora epigaea]|uniref:Protein kinase domain-containing protein n=1 Tax=Diversispora epigaea TaxID=1348612 RepID=A0A397GCC3_9GLOM|nr:hypothetical protein Glove_658g31 [Diversispora epigaea]
MQLNHRDFGICNECHQNNIGFNWCHPCNAKQFQSEFNKWTSEDAEIDEFIQQTQLKATKYEEVIEWIPFDKFNNIKYLDKGGFGKVFKATWSDGYITYWNSQRKIWERSQQNVCFKRLNTPTNNSEFLQEIKHQLKFRGIWAIAIYGITKNPTENEYMMVMQYARHGSLRKMLNSNFEELTWHNKLKNLYYIALGLTRIHETGLMHRDLHSGNIVNETKTSSYITDFALCKPVIENYPEKTYRVIPYMAPETLNREYTQTSDIYSFSMTMLEVLTSYPPYYNISHIANLVMSICNELKPEIMCEIMEKCWNFEPANRPTAEELKSQLGKYLSDNNEIRKQFKASNKPSKNFIKYDPNEMHSEAIYTSRHIPKITIPEYVTFNSRQQFLSMHPEEKTFWLHSESAEVGNSQYFFEGFKHCLNSVDENIEISNSNNNNDYNDHFQDNGHNEINDHTLISSQVNANIANMNSPHAYQNFKISAYLWAKVDPLPNKKNDLKFSINISDCGAGEMLSDKWPLLRKLGIGYFLDSVEIWITPISNTSDKPFYILKGSPDQLNFSKDIGMSEVLEQSFKSTTTEWELITDGCGVTGLGWRYQYTANSPFKDLNRRRNFAPGKHSCHWITLEAMTGFRVTITQVLCCKITNGWHKYNPITRSKLKKLCPKIAHTLEISFNSLENFNENFANLKSSENSGKLHGDFLNVTFSPQPQIENSKNYNIGNIEIKRAFKKFEDK